MTHIAPSPKAGGHSPHGKFSPSLLRGRIPIPVASGSFLQKGEGVRMGVPGHLRGAALECEGVPLAPPPPNPAAHQCSPSTDLQHPPISRGI